MPLVRRGARVTVGSNFQSGRDSTIEPGFGSGINENGKRGLELPYSGPRSRRTLASDDANWPCPECAALNMPGRAESSPEMSAAEAAEVLVKMHAAENPETVDEWSYISELRSEYSQRSHSPPLGYPWTSPQTTSTSSQQTSPPQTPDAPLPVSQTTLGFSGPTIHPSNAASLTERLRLEKIKTKVVSSGPTPFLIAAMYRPESLFQRDQSIRTDPVRRNPFTQPDVGPIVPTSSAGTSQDASPESSVCSFDFKPCDVVTGPWNKKAAMPNGKGALGSVPRRSNPGPANSATYGFNVQARPPPATIAAPNTKAKASSRQGPSKREENSQPSDADIAQLSKCKLCCVRSSAKHRAGKSRFRCEGCNVFTS